MSEVGGCASASDIQGQLWTRNGSVVFPRRAKRERSAMRIVRTRPKSTKMGSSPKTVVYNEQATQPHTSTGILHPDPENKKISDPKPSRLLGLSWLSITLRPSVSYELCDKNICWGSHQPKLPPRTAWAPLYVPVSRPLNPGRRTPS